jgi:hypothetical protein
MLSKSDRLNELLNTAKKAHSAYWAEWRQIHDEIKNRDPEVTRKLMQEKDQGWKALDRNTDGLKAAAQKKRAEAIARTESAISQLIKDKKPINFEAVANAAGVIIPL